MAYTEDTPKYVWSDSQGRGRYLVSIFRRSFTLDSIPSEAILFHVFADNMYRLRVNNHILGHGPARFVPAFPEYDSYDLQPFLRSGRNVLTVEVHHIGTSTFQTRPGTSAAFIAWGNVAGISLNTPGTWKVQHSDAWDALAPAFSFAQGPVEILDLSSIPTSWFEAESDDSDWPDAIQLEQQQYWGPLQPRSIPLNDYDAYDEGTIRLVAPVHNTETRLACRAYAPDFYQAERRTTKRLFCYTVCLFSPTQQQIELGSFWGYHYCNGHKLEGQKHPYIHNRLNFQVELQQGWNVLYGEVELLQEIWSLPLAWPHDAQIIVRAVPDIRSAMLLRYTDPVPVETLQAQRLKIPATPEDIEQFPFPWHYLTSDTLPHLPARQVSWDRLGEPLEASTLPLTFAANHGQTYSIVLEWSSVYLGRILLEVEAPAGTIIDVSYDERLREDGALDLFRTNPFTDTADRFICRAGYQRIEGIRVRGGHYMQITLRAPEEAEGTITLSRVAVRPATYPLAIEGSFTSSDELFNWIWNTGIATLQANAEDTYTDCPWRERGLYVGDVYVQARVQMAVCRDPRLIRHCILLAAQGQLPDGQLSSVVPAWHLHPHGDYTLILILLVRTYWIWSGDLALVREVWPTIARIWQSSRWSAAASGLWNANDLNLFIDWGVAREARQVNENAVLNAFRYQALVCSAELATALGEHEQATSYTAEAQRLRAIYHQRLWMPQQQLFASGVTETGALSESSLIHSNILALAIGLADSQQAEAMRPFIGEQLRHNREKGLNDPQSGYLELYFLLFALEALYRLDEVALAEDVIRDHYALLREHNAWTLWESFASGDQGAGSLCHGWSAAPLTIFSQYILGVRWQTPGDPDKLLIAPCSETVNQARGTVPHPRGLITIDWALQNDVLSIHLSLPEGIQYTVKPEGRLSYYQLMLYVNDIEYSAQE